MFLVLFLFFGLVLEGLSFLICFVSNVAAYVEVGFAFLFALCWFLLVVDYAVVVEPHSVSQGLIHVFTYAFDF